MSRARSIGRRLLRALAVTLLGAALTVAVVVWRLARGPIDLGFFTPHLERALSRPDGSLVVRVGGTELAWDARAGDIDLRVRAVVVRGARGEVMARVPALAIRPSLRALLDGVLAPSRIELLEPRLRLVREADGRLGLGVGEAEASGALANLLAADLADSAGASALAPWLHAVDIVAGEAELVDRARGATWRAHGVDVAFTRAADGIRLHMGARLDLDGVMLDARGAGLYRPGQASSELGFEFGAVEAAAVAARLPASAVSALLQGLALPVTGTVRVTFDGALAASAFTLEVTGGPGTINVPKGTGGPLAVARLHLVATGAVAARSIVVDELSLELASGARLHLRGRVAAAEGDARAAEADVKVFELPTHEVARLWPVDVAPPARAWFDANVRDGQVRKAHVRLAGRLGGDPQGLALDRVEGTLIFDGLAVRWLPAAPPVVAVAGTATLSTDAWAVRVARGRTAGLTLVRAKLSVADLRSRTPSLAVEAAARGPLGGALALADAPPLGYATAAGIVPARASGTVDGEVECTVPLIGPIDPQRMALSLDARLRDVAVPEVGPGWPLTDGNLTLRIAAEELTLAGRARLAGAPFHLSWREAFAGRDRGRRHVDAAGRLDARERAALGFDLWPYLEGHVEVRANLDRPRGGDDRLDVGLDLRDGVLAVPWLAVDKPSGAAGLARASLLLARTGIAVNSFRLDTAGAIATGQATLAPEGRTLRTLDASIRLGRTPPALLTLTLRPAAGGSTFTLRADDAGALAQAFEAGLRAATGPLTFTGTVALAPGLPLDGRVEVRDVRLQQAPLLQRVVTLASLEGIAGAFRGGGIEFRTVTARVAHRDETITLSDGAATGPMLDVLLSGTIAGAARTATLRGTLVPSYYGLNRAPGRLPIVGGLVGGGKEGLLAIDFTVTGPLAQPRIAVEPLRSLVPGPLRGLLGRTRP